MSNNNNNNNNNNNRVPLISQKELDHLLKQSTHWTLDMDEQLVEMVGKLCEEMDINPFNVDLETIKPGADLLRRYASINQGNQSNDIYLSVQSIVENRG